MVDHGHPLLSLVPPSCMVAPIRDLRNKFFLSSSTIMHSQQPLNLPTVLPSTYTGMDILLGKIPDNYDEVRGRMVSPQPHSPRASSMSSTKSSVNYHERMEHNKLNNDIIMNDDSEGPGVSYETVQEQAIHVSMMADVMGHFGHEQFLFSSSFIF